MTLSTIVSILAAILAAILDLKQDNNKNMLGKSSQWR